MPALVGDRIYQFLYHTSTSLCFPYTIRKWVIMAYPKFHFGVPLSNTCFFLTPPLLPFFVTFHCRCGTCSLIHFLKPITLMISSLAFDVTLWVLVLFSSLCATKTDLVTHISRSRYSYSVSVEAHFGRFPVFSLFVTKSPIFYFIEGLAFHSLLVLSNKNNNHVSYFVIISKRINLNPVIFPHPLFQLLSKKSPPRRVMVTKGNLVERL